MSNSIYANSSNVYEVICMKENATASQVTRTNKGTSEPNTSGHRCYRPAVVCLLVLVVLMMAAIVILWVMLTKERDQIQTSYNNTTIQRDQLETSNNNLIIEKKQLEMSYKIVSEERDQFQKKTDELQKTNDELQKTNDELQKKISQLMKDINTPGWKYFSSSIYFISTEKKSWSEGRHDCIKRGADLVIINSRDEQDFVEVWRRGQGAWIGANDRDREGIWKWVDGKTLTSGFWSSGEPNNKGDEDCAVSGYRSEPVPNWVDVSCSYEYIWICEKKINS